MLKHDLVKEIIITEEQIQARVSELAKEVGDYYQGIEQPLVLVGILRGCLPFFSDFMMKLDIECGIEFMSVESYIGNIGPVVEPRIKIDIFGDIKNRDVVIVEDIIDSGKTLVKLVEHLKQKQPKSIKIMTCLDKKSKRTADIEADWFGFEVPDHFLVGYGLDYQEILRNLPYVAIADIDKIKALESKS